MSKAPWHGAAKPVRAAVQKMQAVGLPLVWFAAAMALLLSPQAVQAHALLVRADPQPNAELTQPPEAIELWFSEPLEKTFTGARILSAGGTEIPAGDPRIDPDDPTHLTLPLESIEPGVYTVVWQTLSSVDGHEWVGSFPLTILNPDGTRPSGTAVEVTVNRRQGLPTLADSLLRWISLLGAALLVGPLSMRWLLIRPQSDNSPDRLIETVISSTAIVGVLLLIASGWLQFLVKSLRLGGLDEFLELLLATRPGRLLLMRQTLLAGVFLLLIPNRWATVLFRRSVPAGAALLTAAALFTYSASSHAAAAPGSGWAVAADFIHLVAAAVWAGGLIFLAILLLLLHRRRAVPDPDRMVLLLKRFSLSAQIAVFTLALTGLFSSFVQLPDPGSLVFTTYGRVLLIKLAIVVAIIALAFFNNRAVQRAEETVTSRLQLSRFSRRVATEAGIAALLFLSVAVLVQTPTPNLAPQAAPAALSLPFNEMVYDGDLAIHLQVTPNQVGHNRYWVHLSHPDSSDIGEVQLVRLFFTHESGEMGQARLDLADLGEDAFAAEGAFLNRDGDWDLSVYVRRRGMNDALAEIAVPVPSAETVRQISRSPWHNPVPRLPAETLVGALLIALSSVPLLWRRSLLRASRPLSLVLFMAALFFLLSGALLALTALL
ncbi:MAG: copper resistance protein CopC [Caldilineaceae bacterium]|nr:copper resistance protein CopC [Caldilineaceae bacterium]